jgi:hypothetical protein
MMVGGQRRAELGLGVPGEGVKKESIAKAPNYDIFT